MSARVYAWICGSTIFLGAFLLFQIQPMLAKKILPWFGGSASVWTTCMLFFQTALFLGYWYAHWANQRLTARSQFLIHVAALGASLLLLPVIPSASWKPLGDEEPVIRILLLMTATVGLPFFLLSTTSPLLQSWYTRVTDGAVPYRYFALSNFASLAALLGYPVFVEPAMSMKSQAWVWSIGYALYVLVCGVAAWGASRQGDPDGSAPMARIPEETPDFGSQFSWFVLAAVASLLSLAATNHLCQNVAPIPFLWVLPLAIYLLTFIVAFDGERWYSRPVMLVLHAAAMAMLGLLITYQTPGTNIRIVIPIVAAGLFLCCMYCHGELARRKPAPVHLTRYYLVIALGGATGALLVGIGAPYYLRGNYEFAIALAGCAIFTLFFEYKRSVVTDVMFAAAAVGMVVVATTQVRQISQTSQVMVRNFYGALRVSEVNGTRQLVHGLISHGTEVLDPARRKTATSYFAAGTGVHRAIDGLGRPAIKVGVVGLGIGTLATYGKPGDTYRFYELNPRVVELAKSHFHFLKDTQANLEIVLGDGRLSLERDAPQNFDLLVIDVFSGDAIPVHFLSREAFELYFRHVRQDGILAMHVSNLALNIAPVVKKLADSGGWPSLRFHNAPDSSLYRGEAEWVLVARKAAVFERAGLSATANPPATLAGLRAWTDDYSALISILR
jgi:hypothetical protein